MWVTATTAFINKTIMRQQSFISVFCSLFIWQVVNVRNNIIKPASNSINISSIQMKRKKKKKDKNEKIIQM
jgi:hypothetical protein